MKRLTVLVDMDDTIEDLLGAWVATLNQQYGTSVDPNDVSDWDVAKFFPTLTKPQVFAPIYSDDFWRTVKPIDGAADALQQLIADGHRVYIVTSSFYETLAVKMTDVLFRYFHFLKWEDVIITSHKQLIHGDVLVDDGVHNLEGGDYLKILMDAPHNRSYDAEQGGMHRVTGWDEAYDIITQYAFQSEHDGEEVEHDRMTVILYSTGCPRCKVLKQKLDNSGVQYTVNDSVDDMLALGIAQVPVLSIDGELLPFAKAIEWVNQIH
jgi:5'(3')-deoxyribonucleotidase/glutaredoxin